MKFHCGWGREEGGKVSLVAAAIKKSKDNDFVSVRIYMKWSIGNNFV